MNDAMLKPTRNLFMIIPFDRVFNASKARVLNMDWTWGYSLGGFPPLADLATDRHSLGA